ncbi:hypothetical protein BJP34_16815 [Moorena producens PAL-8-15-08-1]|uniref:Pvc16 N-terminal domain-containing protein n=1 Tax=Moorena producens PAL-8-15-08-1 TaxID=1458985 RepID=A0A1D8TTE8_9CYAN|nr:DUF4255 domain-containing protein [Moorena producens]AOX00887.1 hypothetical protein BJP34_16815 [Moorena producens PAL-8-15-08-1]
MSNSQAIAGVTIMLEFLIKEGALQELGSGTLEIVTTKPLDEARKEGQEKNQINIFLYQTNPNSAWRNLDMPNKVKPGETGKPPLALNLYYLITAYGKDNEDTESQTLLGVAMRVLHDHPLIRTYDIDRAIAKKPGFIDQGLLDESKKKLLEDSNLANQIERISVTPNNLSIEEISKLWGTFQTQYRISAAYKISVVLIESQIPVKTPLPVLSRGADDRGPDSQTGTIPPLPSLTAIKLPQNESYFTVGKDLILEGYNLENSEEVHCGHPHLENPIVLTNLKDVSATQIRVTLDGRMQWLAGFYTVTVQVQESDRTRITNSMTFPLVPEVTAITYPDRGNRLTLTCNPAVKEGQEVALLLGDLAIPYQFPTPQSQDPILEKNLTFNVSNVTPGTYVVRLRVDGVDSIPIDFTKQPPEFKEDQKVTIQES